MIASDVILTNTIDFSSFLKNSYFLNSIFLNFILRDFFLRTALYVAYICSYDIKMKNKIKLKLISTIPKNVQSVINYELNRFENHFN